ncbi:MAG: NAD-dependent epimerase/dehydratase [Chitinophagaceae bacterium]|nr:NAD-dependent epimerase/dehydratase [Chitinophagaceae bacterium]
MKILITGGAGFVGASLALFLKESFPSYSVYCLDNLKRRGSELNISRLKEKGISFIHGDIRNKEDFYELPETDSIIECSAEPSVLAGLSSAPDYLLNTNLVGTLNVLSFAVKTKASLIFLSTSRVYPIEYLNEINLSETDTRFTINREQTFTGITPEGINEQFPLTGFRSLYGASKLASELFINEYNEFYQLKTIINRCGVIAGPWQMGKTDQGVAALWLAKHFYKQSLNYIGYGGQGKQVRDMLHIADLFTLIDYQLHHIDKLSGQTFNVGGGNECSISLQEMTQICERITGNKIPITGIAETRAADIALYITDNHMVIAATGWKPKKTVENIFIDIYEWLNKYQLLLTPILK